MSWAEAVRLTGVLQNDPASHVAAALNDWTAPRSAEWFALADLIDRYSTNNFKKPKPYPRPHLEAGARRIGRTKRSRAEVLAILAAHGHDVGGA